MTLSLGYWRIPPISTSSIYPRLALCFHFDSPFADMNATTKKTIKFIEFKFNTRLRLFAFLTSPNRSNFEITAHNDGYPSNI